MKPKRTRIAWGLAGIQAAALLAGLGLLGLWVRAYSIAKYRGQGADLGGALLLLAPLAHAQLIGARLQHANLRGADLSGANLGRSDLTGADLSGANLTDASIGLANLQGANLRRARGRPWFWLHTDLRGADLRRSCLRKAHLEGAHLEGADLRRADLFGWKGREPAFLTGARYDARTRWPGAYNPQRHGAVRVR